MCSRYKSRQLKVRKRICKINTHFSPAYCHEEIEKILETQLEKNNE